MKKSKSLMLALIVMIIASLACSAQLWDTPPAPVVVQPPAVQPVTDVCKNIEGVQSTVPFEYGIDPAGNCIPIPREPFNPPATDVCKNIEGVQSTVPAGYQVDVAGNCNLIPPEPVVTDVCKNIEGVQSTVPSGFTVDTAGNCNVIPPESPKNPTATAKGSLDCKPYPSFDAGLVDGIPSGRTVEIVGKTSINSGWYLVKWSTYTCWVYSEFVVVAGDLSKVPEVTVVIPPKEDLVEMTITVRNNFPDKKLCRMALHKVGGGLLRWWEPGKGNWDPGETATFKFPLKNGNYDVYIYTCNGNLVDQTNNFYLEDGGSYVTP